VTSGGQAGTAEQAGQGTEAAARVADVLMLFTSGPPTLGVSAVARELGLSKAVVHRILRTLADRMLISVDAGSRGYRLGPATAALGARALRDSSLRAAGRLVIAELQRVTGETTTLSSIVPGGRVYLDEVPSAQEIKMTVEIGTRFPLHAGSSGKAILAFLPPGAREELLSGELVRMTSRTITDADRLRAELAQTRVSGVASSGGERQPDAGSIASPVFDVDGAVVGSVSVCGPVFRFGEEARARFAPACREAADQVSRALGWRGGLPEPEDTE
jgi:DNA-binding IclR family transcriptional regulator